MQNGIKTIVYDEQLRLEAYRFEGISQPFPNHFHEYYVIGYIEKGKRILSCMNKEYLLQADDMILFHPGDNHACWQADGGTLDYCGINIPRERMLEFATEITGLPSLPGFSAHVFSHREAGCYYQHLHEMIMNGSKEFEKEELLLLLLSLLIQKYGQPFEEYIPECRMEIDNACLFMQQHYSEAISLEQLCKETNLSKSTLLRAFTKTKGVTPYRYLESIRIGEAKKLLERGRLPIEAALLTGFSDQSHFTNYFSRYIGLTPGAYREIFFNKSQEA